MIAVIERDTTQVVSTFRASVGTSAAAITSTAAAKVARGVGLKAAAANTGVIYVGPSGVTANSAAATDGWQLEAGQELFLPIDDPRKIFAIASAVSQNLFVIVL